MEAVGAVDDVRQPAHARQVGGAVEWVGVVSVPPPRAQVLLFFLTSVSIRPDADSQFREEVQSGFAFLFYGLSVSFAYKVAMTLSRVGHGGGGWLSLANPF